MENELRKQQAKINKHFKGIYYQMREQTCNPKNRKYAYYHELGINSNVWKYFDDFYNDMYQEYWELAIDVNDCYRIKLGRYDEEGSFCKQNCYFYITYGR